MAKSRIYPRVIQAEVIKSEYVRNGVKKVADELLDEANKEVPIGKPARDHRVPGRLRASGHTEPILDGYAVVYDAPYARMVHDGTSAHRIPKSGNKLLAWTDPSSGKTRFAMHVEHPGTRPNRWLDRAIDNMSRNAR